jgi:glycosyltransferase involved in cell wall biosynthesis
VTETGTTATAPMVSVNVPCYRQLPLARRAVRSILNQSLHDIEITLVDDGESDEYREWVASLGDSRVVYRRNPVRLGAMRNMFSAIAAGRGPFTIAFHEDDLMGRHYLEAAIRILSAHPRCAFVACRLREFDGDLSDEELSRPGPAPAYTMFASPADFVRGILQGAEPMFGSVVYRRAALEGAQADHDHLATLVDRPFLLSIVEHGWSAAVIEEPLVRYRHHGEDDTRHLAMTTDNVLRLLGTYRAALPGQWSDADRSAFFTFTGYWLFELYRLTPPAQRPPVWKYLWRAWREGLYNPRARGRFGARQILRALANQT